MYTNSLTVISLSGGATPVEPRLHARFYAAPGDPSGLTPLPIDGRASVPIQVSGSTSLTAFTFNDTELSTASHDVAVSMFVSPPRPEEGPLYRSGSLTDLPAPYPGNSAGFFSVGVPDPVEVDVLVLNDTIAARFASGPVTESGATITGATLGAPSDAASNPASAAQLSLTAVGTWSGPLPSGAPPWIVATVAAGSTVAFIYSARLEFRPELSPYDTDKVIGATLSNGGLAFLAAGGGLGVITTAFEAAMLNLLAPSIVLFSRTHIEDVIGGFVSQEARNRTSVMLGVPRNADDSPGPLRPGVTVSAQTVTIHSDASPPSVRLVVAAGAIGSLVPPPAPSAGGSGCLGALTLLPLLGLFRSLGTT